MKQDKSGLYILKDNDSSIDECHNELRSFVCPNCGNTHIDGREIKWFPEYEESVYVRWLGGFGSKQYRWIPHKCTACGCKFMSWTTKHEINGGVIAWYIFLIGITSIMCFVTALALSGEPALWFFGIPYAILLIGVVNWIDRATYRKDTGPSIIESYAKPIDEPEDTAYINDFLCHQLASSCMATPNQIREAMRVLATGNLYEPEPIFIDPETVNKEEK